MSESASIAKDFLEKLKDYALSVALIGYTSGFLVTSIYLGKYGIANFDIVRAHYVLAGIVFLFFAFTCVFPAYLSWELYVSLKEKSFKNLLTILGETITANLGAVFFIFLPLYFVDILAYDHPMSLAFPMLSISVWLINSAFLILIHFAIKLFFVLPKKFRAWFYIEEDSIERLASNAIPFTYIPTFLLSLILIVVFGYSLLVYPDMPQQLGGGAKIPVDITYKSSAISRTLYMLDRTSNTIIFLGVDCATNKEKAVEVASDDILSMSPINLDQLKCAQSIPPIESDQSVYPQSTPTLEFQYFPIVTPTGSAEPGGHGRP